VKNKHESSEKNKPKHLLCVTPVTFRSNKVRPMLEMYSTKAITVGENSNAWVKSWRFRGESPDAAAILQLFSKITHF